MTREKLIDSLTAVDSLLNSIIAQIEKGAPMLMDYSSYVGGRPVRDRFDRAKEILRSVMNQIGPSEPSDAWTEQDEKNLSMLVCLCNLWQEKNSTTLLPKRACEMREWLHDKFPNAARYKRPRVPIEYMTWDEWVECKTNIED